MVQNGNRYIKNFLSIFLEIGSNDSLLLFSIPMKMTADLVDGMVHGVVGIQQHHLDQEPQCLGHKKAGQRRHANGKDLSE